MRREERRKERGRERRNGGGRKGMSRVTSLYILRETDFTVS